VVIGKGKPKKLGTVFVSVSVCTPRIAHEVKRGLNARMKCEACVRLNHETKGKL